MPRQLFVDQDLSNQIMDATLFADGLRQSYFRNCNLTNTQFIGDIRGCDYYGCTGAADWRLAQTYGSYWRGNTLNGSLFPPDIGFLHHQPVAEIIRAAATALPNSTVKTKILAVGAYVLSDPINASWDTSKAKWWDTLTAAQRVTAVTRFRALFAPYPQLAQRFEELVKAIQAGANLWAGGAPTSATVTWPDGASVIVDALALPPLPEMSRYALARWIEAQADAQQPGPHHCFVWTAFPMIVQIMPGADWWLIGGGYSGF